jgi:hypothetical protein
MNRKIIWIRFLIASLVVIFPKGSNAQNKYYNFNLYDGKDYLFTMNQSNDLMLNSLRYIGNEINGKDLSKREKKVYFISMFAFTSLLGQAITHEEGHRSVLSELGIGSVSKPFVDKNLVAKVTGVTDETLINIRNNDLPSYIRLHTAGLESDYAYLKKSDAYLNFNEEKSNVLYPDYLARKLGTQIYFLTNLLKSKAGIKEVDDLEMDRDVVGHDLYGMIRHLHRPNMQFFRYTEMSDLTKEEKAYAKRMGYMSLLNFINPNIYKMGDFSISNSVRASFSVNYSLAPFGDFVEQNAYLTIKNKYKINPYFRQYFNKSYTFLAAGVNLHNYAFKENRFLLNTSVDFWNQPKNLEFKSKVNEFGLGLKSELAIRFSSWDENKKAVYFNFGASYKTKGFIPEVPSLREDFRLNLGFVISVNK